MASTITLNTTVNYAQQLVRGQPLTGVLQVANEPAISMANWVRNFILAPPFSWRWNRSQTVFIATPGIQDYNIANSLLFSQDMTNGVWFKNTGVTATANFARSPIGDNTANRIQYDGSGINQDLRLSQSITQIPTVGVNVTASIYLMANSGNPTVLVSNGPSFQSVTLTNTWQRVSVSSVNNSTTNFPVVAIYSSDNSPWDILVWGAQLEFNAAANPYLATTNNAINAFNNLGYLEKATVSDGTTEKELQMDLVLASDLQTNRPISISPVIDNMGFVTMRLLGVPDQQYTVTVLSQNASSNFVSLTDTWAPIPDYFYYLIETGFAAKTFEYTNDERYPATMQLFVKQVIAASAGLADTQNNIYMQEFINSQREVQSQLGNAQVGRAGRGLFG